jgi:hypothetical protein
MILTSKYDLNQHVVGILSLSTNQKVDCLTCQQTGKVTIKSETFICPKCEGKCLYDKYIGERWVVVEESIIGLIRISVRTPEYMNVIQNLEVEYMLKDTGIGTGTIWHEDMLWPTREEAQAECDRRNEL